MTDLRSQQTRREWMRIAAAASLGAGCLDAQRPASSDTTWPGAQIYNIVDFGAKGDGKTLDTKAVQAAIDACNKDEGGTVLVPAGVFVIGTVEMKSNVTLRIAAQGKLLGSADGKQYQAADAIAPGYLAVSCFDQRSSTCRIADIASRRKADDPDSNKSISVL